MSTSIRGSLLFLSLLLFLFFNVCVASAQSFPSSFGSIALVPSPSFPGPQTTVTLSLDDYSVQSIGSTIVWYVDAVEDTSNRNARSITLKTKNIGEKTVVKVVLYQNGMARFTTTHTLYPSVTDLIVEASTHVPSFYKGRILPSVSAPIRVVALLHNDAQMPLTAYSYKWTLGTEVLFGGPVQGQYSVSTDMPYFGDEELTVEIFDTDGVLVGENAILLHAIDPELHFYEFSPLRGLMQKELYSPLKLLGEETTIFAEPYYLDAEVRPQGADFVWTIDGTKVAGDEHTPHSITLTRQGESGKNYVEFSAVTKKRLPQYTRHGFDVFFE